MSVPTPGPHCLDDGVLLALLDGEAVSVAEGGAGAVRAGEDADAERTTEHLQACASCRSRLDALRARGQAVSAWLRAHDPATPSRAAYRLSDSSGAWRTWAAAAAVVLLVAAVAGPASAWIRPNFGSPPDTPAAEAVAEPGSSTTRFRVSSAVLTLSFESLPRGLALSVVVTSDSLAALVSPTADGEVVVEPDAIELRGMRDAGTYALAVPASVGSVVLRRPGLPDTTLAVDPERPVRVALGPGGA